MVWSGGGVLAVVALALCSATSEGQQQGDSSGVRLVRYGARNRAPAQWRVEQKPLLVIGGAEGDGAAELSAVVGVARLRDGALAVANQATNEIRLFDARGTYLRALGRRGQGPGEFDRLSQLFRVADTVVGVDRSRRGAVFAPDGTLLCSLPIPLYDQGQFPTYVGFFDDGSVALLALDPPPADTSKRELVATGTLGVRRENGATVRLDRIPMYEVRKQGGNFSPVFLGPVYRVATAGDRVCVGWAARWEVTCYARDGRMLTRTTRAVEPGAVTEEDRRVFREGFLRANRGAAPPDKLEATANAFPIANRRSAYGRFVPSTTGELWVGEFDVSEEVFLGRAGLGSPAHAMTWSILDRTGAWIASVQLPARFELVDAGADYVAGILRDDDDVESAVVYRLNRR